MKTWQCSLVNLQGLTRLQIACCSAVSSTAERTSVVKQLLAQHFVQQESGRLPTAVLRFLQVHPKDEELLETQGLTYFSLSLRYHRQLSPEVQAFQRLKITTSDLQGPRSVNQIPVKTRWLQQSSTPGLAMYIYVWTKFSPRG